MSILKRAAAALLCLAALSAWAKPGPGIMPNRKHGKSKNSYAGAALLTRGPLYSDPNAAPPASAIPGLVAGTDPNNPNQMAAQSMGFSQSNCSGSIQSQVQALTAQLAGITAQLNGLLALERAEVAAEYACPPPAPPTYSTACVTGHANKALAYANQALVIGQQALPIAAQLQALQGQASACSGGGSSPQLNPPAVSLQAAANRFGFSLPGGSIGQGGSASAFGANSIFNGSSALDQLKLLDAQGEGANWDNSRALGSSLSSYANAARRVNGIAPLVLAGRAVEKEGGSYDDPRVQAQAEYAKVAAGAMGSSYDGLVAQRHEAAEKVADDTLGGMSGTVPLLNPTGAPEMPSPDPSALDEARDAAREWAKKTAWEKLKEGIISLSPDGESMQKVIEIHEAAHDGTQSVLGKVGAAIGQVGSLDMGHDKVDAVVAAVDQAKSSVGDKAGYRADPPKVDLVGAILGVFK